MTASPEDIDLFRATVREAMEQLSTSADVRRAMATAAGFDQARWHRLARELGLPGLMLPSQFGGSEMTAAELAIAFEECGARLLCAPLFATAGLAVPLLQALGDDAAIARYGPHIAAGDLTATVALAEDGGYWRVDTVQCKAIPTHSGWAIDGVKNYVVDGATAGLTIVIARTDADLGVFAVRGDAPAQQRAQLVTLDQTRKQARLVFSGTPAERIGARDARSAIARATAVSRSLLAAEQVGGAQRCLDLTVDYAKNRLQFGRPIGSFQAVKHRLAEGLILIESARSGALAAANAVAADDEELEHIAAIAALASSEAYIWITEQTIQLHGGIGFTWEHDAHLYFKRARASALLLGTVADLVDLISQQLETTIS